MIILLIAFRSWYCAPFSINTPTFAILSDPVDDGDGIQWLSSVDGLAEQNRPIQGGLGGKQRQWLCVDSVSATQRSWFASHTIPNGPLRLFQTTHSADRFLFLYFMDIRCFSPRYHEFHGTFGGRRKMRRDDDDMLGGHSSIDHRSWARNRPRSQSIQVTKTGRACWMKSVKVVRLLSRVKTLEP